MTSSRSGKNGRLPAPRVRFLLVRGAVIFAFASLAARLVYVQAVLRNDLQEKADRQTRSHTESHLGRWSIVDRDGRVIAETVEVASCFVDPTLVGNRSAVARELAAALNLNEPALARRIKEARGSFLWIKRNVPAPVVAQLKQRNLPGVAFKTEQRRNYPMGVMASHLLGLVGVDGRGLSGIEQGFEKTLNADPDRAHGTDPEGQVQLTLDADIQRVVERELDWGARKTGAKRGIAIVQNPATGEILASAAWPPVSLDPDNPPAPGDLRVPELVDVFEPGSTFKLVTSAAAVEEKLISPHETFDGENGAWKVLDITIHDHEPLRRMTLDDIMIHSSNIGAAKIGERLGSQRLYQYARLFGFGVFPATGIQGEAKGVLRVPAKWSGVSKYVVAFGQEVSVTAMQLVDAYSAIANGGQLLEPRVVKAIVSPTGETLARFGPVPVRRVVSEATAKEITRLLTLVVEKGTGVNAQIQWDPQTRVAGKTGTAQKFDRKLGRYNDTLALVSFCGYFPADHPAYTMVVILDEPEGRSFGGLDAAPVFRRIAEQLHSPSIS